MAVALIEHVAIQLGHAHRVEGAFEHPVGQDLVQLARNHLGVKG